MLTAITDIKNFLFGTVTEPVARVAEWGSWGLMSLAIPGFIVGMVAGPAAGLGLWLGGTALLSVAGAATGLLFGGAGEVAEGWRARAKDDKARQAARAPQEQGAPEQAPAVESPAVEAPPTPEVTSQLSPAVPRLASASATIGRG